MPAREHLPRHVPRLSRERRRDEPNPIEKIIRDAVRTTSNFLVPAGLADHLWRRLTPEERLYVKGLDVEHRGDLRTGVYQEFARGFGVRDYRDLLHTGKANRTRLKTASEFGRSLVRHALYAVWRAAERAAKWPTASRGSAVELHIVAHGEGSSATLEDVKRYYEGGQVFLDYFKDALWIEDDAA